jgi:hypothetical protein
MIPEIWICYGKSPARAWPSGGMDSVGSMGTRVPITPAHRHHRTHARTETHLRFQHEAVEAREAGLELSPAQLAAVEAFDRRALAGFQHIMRAQMRLRVTPTRVAVQLERRQLRNRHLTSRIRPRRGAARARSSNPRTTRRQRAKSRSPGRQSEPPDDGGHLLEHQGVSRAASAASSGDSRKSASPCCPRLRRHGREAEVA